ncbi:hypothetical protein K3495_g1529 [Podosphaera aphanis]|nr:hypothetical protein K3495_g1529 [Podosphaera aphanis]
MDIEDLLNDDEQSANMQKKSSRRTKRAVRQPREIVGRLGKGPVDYKKLAEEIKVEVSLMDLFQISPDMSKAFRKFSTRVNERTMREQMRNELPKRKIVEDRNDDDNSEVLFGKAAVPSNVTNERAFRIPVTVKAKKDGKLVRDALPISVAQADQGSDMIIVTVGFLEKFGLPVKTLSSRGMNGLTMNVADGTSARLTHYSKFEIGVIGIWRKVEAFVRPFSERNADEAHLLLGLPWLHTVCAKIWVKESMIEIGDPERGEKVEKIQGLTFVEGNEHKLVLCPKRRKKVVFVESSCEESESDSNTDEDFSDEEDLSELFAEKRSGKNSDLSMS